MLPPFVYPFWGILYLIKRPDMLLQVLGLSVLEIVVPVYWFSDSLVNQHHNQVFDDVFRSQYGSGPVRQLNAEQRARLAVKVQEREAVKRERANRVPITQAYQNDQVHAVVRTLMFVFGPPRPNAPIVQRVVKRIIQAPVKVLFPLAPKLLAATTAGASAPALAAAALSPWLARKGVRGAAEIDALSAVNRASMLGFGGVAFGLGLVPLLSWVLGFTNSVGAAIFAADLERENVPLI